jgi:hypothetical protein
MTIIPTITAELVAVYCYIDLRKRTVTLISYNNSSTIKVQKEEWHKNKHKQRSMPTNRPTYIAFYNVKLKECRNRPGVSQRVPGGLDSHIS